MTCFETCLNEGSFMQLWPDLVAAALLGTERRSAPLSPFGGPLGDLLGRLDGTSQEGALLGAAAAVALYRRAGRLPVVADAPLPPPCPPERLAVCSPQAAQDLALMLGGQHREVL